MHIRAPRAIAYLASDPPDDTGLLAEEALDSPGTPVAQRGVSDVGETVTVETVGSPRRDLCPPLPSGVDRSSSFVTSCASHDRSAFLFVLEPSATEAYSPLCACAGYDGSALSGGWSPFVGRVLDVRAWGSSGFLVLSEPLYRRGVFVAEGFVLDGSGSLRREAGFGMYEHAPRRDGVRLACGDELGNAYVCGRKGLPFGEFRLHVFSGDGARLRDAEMFCAPVDVESMDAYDGTVAFAVTTSDADEALIRVLFRDQPEFKEVPLRRRGLLGDLRVWRSDAFAYAIAQQVIVRYLGTEARQAADFRETGASHISIERARGGGGGIVVVASDAGWRPLRVLEYRQL